MKPNVSICIPAYCEVQFLDAAIKSCLLQKYTSFEIIVTDDTPDKSVEQHVSGLIGRDPRIKYFRNNGPHGAAANSNYAVTKANGQWIKFMYQDDLFADNECLGEFTRYIQQADFIFSPCIQAKHGSQQIYRIDPIKYEAFMIDPVAALLKFGNLIGAPSATLFRKDKFVPFDQHFVWRFDVFSYLQMAANGATFHCLERPAVKITIHEKQLTERVSKDPQINLSESLQSIRTIGLIDKYKKICRYQSKKYAFDAGRENMQFSQFRRIIQSSGYNIFSMFFPWLFGKVGFVLVMALLMLKHAICSDGAVCDDRSHKNVN